jgi:hypothetical protein
MRRTAAVGATHLAAVLLVAALQGCATIGFWGFTPAEASGQGRGVVKLYLHGVNGTKPEKYTPDEKTIAAYPGLQEKLDECTRAEAGAQTLGVVVLPVIGKLLFDLYMDKQARDLDALKASAEKSYSARMVIGADVLFAGVSRGRCFVLTRTVDKDTVPQFVGVLALERAPRELVVGRPVQAFTFTPTYVAARSAVAATKNASKPKVSVSFALTVRGIGTQDNGLPTFAQVGEGTYTVSNVQVGTPVSPQKAICQPDQDGKGQVCPTSDPIPLVVGNTTLAVGIGITETGDVGVNFDAAKSELGAVKAAIGPLISDILKEKLKKEE